MSPAAGVGTLGERRIELAGWLVLGALLAATLVAAATFDRSGWPALVGDEATYAMQAASLARDVDLAYERADYDRFVADWGRRPDGLILQSGDGGRRMTFGKPPLYAMFVAPAVRLAPVRGAPVAGALLLALTAVVCARVLRRTVGAAAPLWVAALCFASVAFAYVFWVHADLFLMCSAALGLALAYRGEAGAPAAGPTAVGRLAELYEPPAGAWESAAAWRPLARWAAAGALLAVPGAFRPFYLVLLAPAALAARAELAAATRGRWRRPAALLAGALLVLAGSALAQRSAGGDWSPYGGERQGFYERTGFPLVDFPAEGWDESVRRWGNTAWLFEGVAESYGPPADASLWGWNAAYLIAGRNVGVLPYFLPVVLGLAAYSGRGGRWLLVAGVLVALACFLWVRPFNFYGGAGAIANRYFLPLYPALWFLAGRPPARGSGGRAAAAVAVAALAAPLLWPLWSSPRSFPVGEDGRYRHVGELARRLLPYETTQSHVPGGSDRAMDGLWVRLLGGGVEPRGEDRAALVGGAPAELLVGSPQPLASLMVRFGRSGPSHLEVEGAVPGETILSPDGGIAFLLEPGRPRAVHPMWWSDGADWWLYELELAADPAADRRMTFTLAAGLGAAGAAR